MKIVLRALLWIALIALLVPLGGALYFGSVEGYIYLTRSESKAQKEAEALFLRICEREGLDPHSFSGPYRPSTDLDRERNFYTFVWQRGPNETIWINVSYLPHDLTESVSRALIERKREPGSSPPLVAGCQQQLISIDSSPDSRWTAMVLEGICSSPEIDTTGVTDIVYLLRRPQKPGHENEVFAIEERGDPANRPLIRWMSSSKLQITVRNKSLIVLQKDSYEGVDMVIKFEPHDPKLR